MELERPVLHVCVTCGSRLPPADGAPPGERLFQALTGAADLDVRPARCLSSCENRCTAAISAPGKWTYLLGGLGPELAEDLLLYAAAYARSATGTVLPSRRPPSLERMVLGRAPGLGQEVPT